MGEQEHLRVLIANEKRDRLELLAQVVAGLGHEVIAREIYVKEVGAVTERERPDVALVGLGLSSDHALDLITEIVREAACPVIALLSAKDPAYVHEAAKRGVFAYIVDGDSAELQSAIDITLRRFAEDVGGLAPQLEPATAAPVPHLGLVDIRAAALAAGAPVPQAAAPAPSPLWGMT